MQTTENKSNKEYVRILVDKECELAHYASGKTMPFKLWVKSLIYQAQEKKV